MALAVITASIGAIGVLISIGYLALYVLASIPLLALGIYTLAFTAIADDKRYYILWGSLMTGLGTALAMETVTGNLLLNLSILLMVSALIGVLLAFKNGK